MRDKSEGNVLGGAVKWLFSKPQNLLKRFPETVLTQSCASRASGRLNRTDRCYEHVLNAGPAVGMDKRAGGEEEAKSEQ
jgi:hypothetical protein